VDAASLDTALLAGSAVLLLAVVAVRASAGVGLPSLLIYLAIGLLLGESVLGVRFDDAETAHALGFAALVIILAEGGLTTRWSAVRPSVPAGVALATVGVAVSVAVIAVAAHYFLSLSWRTAILLGAVTSPTDAAAVFAVLRRLPLRGRLVGTLEAESGLNDAPTLLLVVLLSAPAAGQHGWPQLLALVVFELVAGVLLGAAVGVAGAWLLRRIALPATGLYPISVLAIAVLAYAAGAALHTSGFAAVYIAALVLGNANLPHRTATRSFAEGLAWLAQIGLFIMLGLLASPSTFTSWDLAGGLVMGGVLTLLARPLSVMVCCTPLRIPWREQTFLAFAGLRGAVPIVLATIPLAAGTPNAGAIFNLVFVLVVVLTLLATPALPALGRRLGVTVERSRDVDIEAAPLERIDADLLVVRISGQSRLHGVEVAELRLPTGASVSLIVRAESSFTPGPQMTLHRGDDVLIVTPRARRELTERRLQSLSRGGRLASWLDAGDV
jgi:cell volume regulation protein A